MTAVWRATSEQDWALCEANYAGIASRGYRPGPLSPVVEASVEGFLDWYVDALADPPHARVRLISGVPIGWSSLLDGVTALPPVGVETDTRRRHRGGTTCRGCGDGAVDRWWWRRSSGPRSSSGPRPRPERRAAAPRAGGDGTRRVALGDSWAAGTAAGEVEAASGTCRRSPRAYPAVVARAAGETSWTSRACASATGGGNGQFTSLGPATEVVTATVGADATGLGALASACSATGTPARCDDAMTRFDRALTTLPRALDAVARRHPEAGAARRGDRHRLPPARRGTGVPQRPRRRDPGRPPRRRRHAPGHRARRPRGRRRDAVRRRPVRVRRARGVRAGPLARPADRPRRAPGRRRHRDRARARRPARPRRARPDAAPRRPPPPRGRRRPRPTGAATTRRPRSSPAEPGRAAVRQGQPNTSNGTRAGPSSPPVVIRTTSRACSTTGRGSRAAR